MDDVIKVALLLRGLHLWVMWVVFALFHLTLLVITIFCFWLWQISPTAVATTAKSVFRLLRLSTLAQIAGTLGVTVPVVLYLYLRVCWRVYTLLSVPFLFREIAGRSQDDS